jgi:hypothetical protein
VRKRNPPRIGQAPRETSWAFEVMHLHLIYASLFTTPAAKTVANNLYRDLVEVHRMAALRDDQFEIHGVLDSRSFGLFLRVLWGSVGRACNDISDAESCRALARVHRRIRELQGVTWMQPPHSYRWTTRRSA